MDTLKADYNRTINGFRGLCVVLVFLFHVEESKILPPVGDTLAAHAALQLFQSFTYAVEMFFLVSGYVIVGSLLRHRSISGFLKDRVMRIFPVWVPLLMLAFLIAPYLHRDIMNGASGWGVLPVFVANLLFLTPTIVFIPLALPPAWSLSYEWIFYFAASAVFAVHRRWGKFAAIAIATITGALLIDAFPRALFFVPGVLVWLFQGRLRSWRRLLRFPLPALLVFLLSWQAAGFRHAEAFTPFSSAFGDIRLFHAALAFASGFYLFACIATEEGRLSAMLRRPEWQFMGNISYSFYLLSTIVMFPIKRLAVHITSPWAALIAFAAVSFAISVLMSWMSWRYVEKRFTRWLKRHTKRLSQTTRPNTCTSSGLTFSIAE